MSLPAGPTRCMRLNELRHAATFDALGDERERIGTGAVAYTPWACKAVGLDLEAPLTDDDLARIVDFHRSHGVPPALELTAHRGTTVLPAYRRRGVQKALIAHRLNAGFERGSELAIIESKPGIPTERNAARLGFSLAYTRPTLRLQGE